MEWKKILDEDCVEELEELIKDDIQAGFLSNEEIQEDCILYLEYNYPEDVEKVSKEDFFEIVLEYRGRFQNTGTQENYKKLDLAFGNMEKRGIVTAHFAGFTMEDGYDIVNEKIEEHYKNSEKIIGCCFYIMQDLMHVIHEDTTSLMFTFGNCFDKPTAEEVGKVIVEEFEKAGFIVDWNGSADKKIAILDFKWDKQYED